MKANYELNEFDEYRDMNFAATAANYTKQPLISGNSY